MRERAVDLRVRLTGEQRDAIKHAAARTGQSASAYVAAKALAGAGVADRLAEIEARMEALEAAIQSVSDRDDGPIVDALDALAERVGAGQKDGPRPPTIADMHALDKSIEAVIKRETAAVQRALFAALKAAKPSGAVSTPAPSTHPTKQG